MLGHGELLELRLLEKSARQDFIIARHHSSKWQKKWKMVDNQKISAVHVFRAVSLLDKKVTTARIALLDKGFGKWQLLDTIYSKEIGVHVRQLG